MDIVALVPARGGSVRVKNKNLRHFGGEPLVARKVRQLLSAKQISRVYVGSDSEEILEIAETAGAIAVRRDDVACDESISPANAMISDFANRVEGEVAVWAHCTNPFIYGRHYDAAIEAYANALASGFDSLLTVTRMQSHMWNEFGFPANYNPFAERHTLAKELRPVYFQDGGIFIQTLARFQETRYFFGRFPSLHELDFPYSFDINTPEEFQLGEAIRLGLDDFEGFNASGNLARATAG